MTGSLERLSTLDRAMVDAVKRIKILSAASWPIEIQQRFLADLAQGRRQLPKITYPKPDFSVERAALREIREKADPAHPLGQYLRAQCEAFILATRMLEHLGRPQMTTYSCALYGRPGDLLADGYLSNVDAAWHFLDAARELQGEDVDFESEYCIPATTMRDELQSDIDTLFGAGVVRVDVDPHLAAKAAAGPSRIRLRGGTCFSEYDRRQLLEHEAFVHSLTALNGRAQPHFPSFGMNSPRITATQEGLATFAELITGAIDLSRMQRLSLRIVAIDRALSGANFFEVFDFFREHEQSDAESFNSTMRVFRGAPLHGGHAFTKDGVYLHGLLEVHTFFQMALKQRRLNLLHHLFAGKMTLEDAVNLEPMFAEGVLQAPRWLPPWMQRIRGLSGTLAFSLFANRIQLEKVALTTA